MLSTLHKPSTPALHSTHCSSFPRPSLSASTAKHIASTSYLPTPRQKRSDMLVEAGPQGIFSATPVGALPKVFVQVENTSWTSRKLHASVEVRAPIEMVWDSLTDYENLATFIPSLTENKCLQRRANGALVYQVGAQDVAMGIKFSAACTLECTEYADGVPQSMCSFSGDGSDDLFPFPKTSLANQSARDITFGLIKGDFKAFKGIWRMQQYPGNSSLTHLCYAVFVRPQQWLPVGLIQNRIEKEILRNLDAVRLHAEQLVRSNSPQRAGSPMRASSPQRM